MEKIRVFTAFAGYDSQCMALDMIKEQFPTFDYELVGWSEIDKNAIMAHNAVYPLNTLPLRLVTTRKNNGT